MSDSLLNSVNGTESDDCNCYLMLDRGVVVVPVKCSVSGVLVEVTANVEGLFWSLELTKVAVIPCGMTNNSSCNISSSVYTFPTLSSNACA